jgi:glyoxylase-like metal-dependent hydrolase (beta-lactamase superfamily II)
MKLTTFKIEKDLGNNPITVYPTLIQINNRNYLIDCGYEETFNEFTAALATLGVTVRYLYAIIISHDDIDHLGALFLFKEANKDLIIYSSKIEEPSVSGKVKAERLLQAEQSLMHIPDTHKDWALQFIQQLKNIQRVDVNHTLDHNDTLEQELIVIHTPGHTKGHISFYIPGEKTVIANDAIVIEDGKLNIANPAYTLDLPEAIKSIERISALKPEKLICYHGGIMNTGVQEQLHALLEKYKFEAASEKGNK